MHGRLGPIRADALCIGTKRSAYTKQAITVAIQSTHDSTLGNPGESFKLLCHCKCPQIRWCECSGGPRKLVEWLDIVTRVESFPGFLEEGDR